MSGSGKKIHLALAQRFDASLDGGDRGQRCIQALVPVETEHVGGDRRKVGAGDEFRNSNAHNEQTAAEWIALALTHKWL